ncbi:retropepsin-like aspartic protease [Clostridium guangxiense]|uniref:retropepsin-like aspartic protease n=1 Tax=Clostridium guangxiense TaxID=1662055 RepID=UPI001E3AB857|nr:retropepsin-like aspartic protease [Clostridium guangxiense]MCD2347846.1 retropepsin-like domain-containing protein [Clostridium guangxiense]
MKLEYKNGLLYTSIKLKYGSKIVEINNIVVDTGASFCIIEPSAIEMLGITISKDDEIETFYGVNGAYSYVKRIAESIIIDKVTLNNVEFYLGTIDENINGLLGLDVLIKSKSIINLNKMEIEIKYN